MATITLDMNPHKSSNEEMWDLIEQMLTYAESIGPRVRLSQETKSKDSILITINGSDEQVSSLYEIVDDVHMEKLNAASRF